MPPPMYFCCRVTKATARGARSKARFEGWDMHLSAATATSRRGPAPGGVAIAVRRGRANAMLQLSPARSVGAEGRLVAAIIEGGIHGGPLMVANIYLDPDPAAKQLNSDRVYKLQTLGHGAWIVAGDWNAEPRELSEGPLVVSARGQIVAPPTPTCFPTGARPSTLDWAVVGPDIADQKPRAIALNESALPTHRPVKLTLPKLSVPAPLTILKRPREIP